MSTDLYQALDTCLTKVILKCRHENFTLEGYDVSLPSHGSFSNVVNIDYYVYNNNTEDTDMWSIRMLKGTDSIDFTDEQILETAKFVDGGFNVIKVLDLETE